MIIRLLQGIVGFIANSSIKLNLSWLVLVAGAIYGFLQPVPQGSTTAAITLTHAYLLWSLFWGALPCLLFLWKSCRALGLVRLRHPILSLFTILLLVMFAPAVCVLFAFFGGGILMCILHLIRSGR
jgi:glucan phosphoethanolaminetransferase (alkaline phosphatase superfamily)